VARVPRTAVAVGYVRVENDGCAVHDLLVQGQGSKGRFRVIYQRGGPRGPDITAAVVNGTYRIEDQFPGAARHLRVTVIPRPSAPAGASMTRRVTVTSATNTTLEDVARVVVVRR
jgi:hypothetical protein